MSLSRRARRLRMDVLEERCFLAGDLDFQRIEIMPSIGDTTQSVQSHFFADLDGDGTDELIVGQDRVFGSDAVNAWYKLNAAGEGFDYVAALPMAYGTVPTYTYYPNTAADMDSDGDLDLLLTEVADTASTFRWTVWLENTDGLGTFAEPVRISNGGSFPTDYDGDGDWDLAFAECPDPPIICYAGWSENQGDGNFLLHGSGDTNDDNFNFDPFDVDGDGQRFVSEQASTSFGSVQVDLDGDGDRDLVFASQSGSVWQENTGDNVTLVVHRLNVPAKYATASDIDFDGDFDLWLQSDDDLVWLQNDGAGNFAPPISLDIALPSRLHLTHLTQTARYEFAALDPATGDVTLVQYDPATRDRQQLVLGGKQTEAAQSAVDMDNDGDLDLVSLNTWYEYLPETQTFVAHPYEKLRNARIVSAADFDGNDQVDLLVAYRDDARGFSAQNVLSWFERIDDQVQPEHVIRTDDSQGIVSQLVVTDLDGDGDSDVAFKSGRQRVNWLENTGGPTGLVDRGPLTTSGQVDRLFAAEDFDQDGDLDFIVQMMNGNIGWIERFGNSYRNHDFVNIVTSDPIFADLDQDGDLDLAYEFNGKLTWQELLDNTWTYSPPRTLGTIGQNHSIHIGDLDGDGDNDVVTSASFDRLTDVDCCRSYLLRNDYPAQNWTQITVDNSQATVQLVADLNQDGFADLIETTVDSAGIVAHMSVAAAPTPGDVNRDGVVSAGDIDRMCVAVLNDEYRTTWDITDDGVVDVQDYHALITTVIQLPYGDANFDGHFNSSDLVTIFAAGKYERTDVDIAGWAEGDWNCDGRFNSADFVDALSHAVYEG